MVKWLTKWRLASLFGLIALVLSGCGKPFLSTLKPAGEVADEQYSLMIFTTALMVIVVAAVTIIFVYVLIRYRMKKGDETKIPKQVEGNHKLEIIWTVIPILIIIIIAVPTVSATFSEANVSPMNKKDSNVVVVNVRANQYWWEFEYPKYGIITSQDLVVPTDEKVYFVLKAADVKHAFWIPAVGGKLDVNTENDNKFYLEFDQEKTKEAGGVFYGKCAELCGPSHALMDFKVRPLPRDQFDAWVEKMKNFKATATTDSAADGEAIFKKSCVACHAVTPLDKRPAAARLAPNLATFGERERIAGVLDHNKENLKAWLKDPEKYKPGNKMTGAYGNLTDDQIDALADYLMGLKVQ